MGQFIGIGAGAGLVSALLFAVITTGNPLAILLYLVAPLPILLAALGWNHKAGLSAAVVGALAVGLVFTPAAGLVFAVGVALPAWWFAYLALLARTNDDGTVEWYPLGRLLMWICGISTGMTLVGALMIAGDYATFVKAFERAVRLIEEINPNSFAGVSDEAKARSVGDLAQLLAAIAPPISAALSVGTTVLLLWAAARIVHASGRLPRPWPAIAQTELPKSALAILAAAVVASLVVSSFGGLFFRSAAAALVMGYCLQGLAVLHVVTRGMAGRGGLIGFAYIVFFLLPGWPVVLYALIGLADSFLGLRARRSQTPRPPSGPVT